MGNLDSTSEGSFSMSRNCIFFMVSQDIHLRWQKGWFNEPMLQPLKLASHGLVFFPQRQRCRTDCNRRDRNVERADVVTTSLVKKTNGILLPTHFFPPCRQMGKCRPVLHARCAFGHQHDRSSVLPAHATHHPLHPTQIVTYPL